MTLGWIALAGAAGALARYGVVQLTHRNLSTAFPWGTLVANVAGCFLMGLLATWLVERVAVNPTVRLAVMSGFLGSFTTFSAFSYETLLLTRDGHWWRAGLNVAASVMLCLLAVALGVGLARAGWLRQA